MLLNVPVQNQPAQGVRVQTPIVMPTALENKQTKGEGQEEDVVGKGEEKGEGEGEGEEDELENNLDVEEEPLNDFSSIDKRNEAPNQLSSDLQFNSPYLASDTVKAAGTPVVSQAIPDTSPHHSPPAQPPPHPSPPPPHHSPAPSPHNFVHQAPPQPTLGPQSHTASAAMPAFRANVVQTPSTHTPIPVPEFKQEELNWFDDEDEQNDLNDPESSRKLSGAPPSAPQVITNDIAPSPILAQQQQQQKQQQQQSDKQQQPSAPMSAPSHLGPLAVSHQIPPSNSLSLPGGESLPQFSDSPPLRATLSHGPPLASLSANGAGREVSCAHVCMHACVRVQVLSLYMCV